MSTDIYEQVVEKAGSVNELAAHLGENANAVSNWRKRGFPASKAKAIEALTGISVKLLLPDEWHLYWPELADTEAA